MALATQCPHCHTTFRVAHDQLKLRAGLVRCGSCKEIFNGIEHLLPSDAMAATRGSVAPEPAPIPAFLVAPAPAPVSAPIPAPAPAAIPAPAVVPAEAPAPAAPPRQAAASDQLDFAYPDMGEDEPEPIPDTVVETASSDPVEVEFIETPRKSPLPTPAFLDLPDQARHGALHGDLPLQAHEEPAAAEDAVEKAAAAASHEEAHKEAHDDAAFDPLTRMTLVDVTDEEGNVPPPSIDEHDPLDKVMEDFERKPARGSRRKGKPYARSPIVSMPEEAPAPTPEPTPASAEEPAVPDSKAEAETDEPAFVKRERRKQTRGRSVGIAMNVGSALLVLLALGQLIYIFRDQIAARLPETHGPLQAACATLGCKVELPSQIDALLIEQGSNQLVALPRKDTSRLSFLLKNTAGVVQAWPEVELTLLDGNNVPLARRVFNPQEYLPAGVDPRKGFSANSEQAVEVYFEFADAKPEDYRVGVFYR